MSGKDATNALTFCKFPSLVDARTSISLARYKALKMREWEYAVDLSTAG
jgi:hypothetical protein